MGQYIDRWAFPTDYGALIHHKNIVCVCVCMGEGGCYFVLRMPAYRAPIVDKRKCAKPHHLEELYQQRIPEVYIKAYF